MKNKIFVYLIGIVAIGLSQFSSALSCWKEIGYWNHPVIGGVVAYVLPQSCYETPLGYVWVKEENITPANNYATGFRIAVRLSEWEYDVGLHLYYRGSYSPGGNYPLYAFGPEPFPKVGNKTAPALVDSYWTELLDRDNANGSGDWELLNLFAPNDVCELPVAIEAIDLAVPYKVFTPDYLPQVDTLRTFSPDAGLACINADQSDHSCDNYKVRFACPLGTWTAWLDRDDQWGSGDYETKSDFPSVCSEPLLVRARLAGTTKVFAPGDDTPDTLAYFNAAQGLACVNSSQTDGFCEDYEVRFLCP